MNLVEFLEERLAEDEATARAACEGGESWDAESTSPIQRHIDRHDPARVLRRVEAGHKLLAEYARISASLAAYRGPTQAAAFMAMQTALKIEAQVYSDHREFEEAWRV